MRNVLITGGAGFIGSNLAILLKRKYSNLNVMALDNLKRRGSELNIQRLVKSGVNFVHGDIRFESDLLNAGDFDLMIECSAEPSVLSGYNSAPNYMLDTNLNGLINCLNVCKLKKSKIIFLSSSRVYPYDKLNQELFTEEETRFTFAPVGQSKLTKKGISESYPLGGIRSLYGASKLSAELIINEYANMYGLGAIINRCGVVAGPWQFGKVDQGVITHWVIAHHLLKPLSYIGYGGKGKQVRDILHIEDLFDAIDLQINNFNRCNHATFNIGGGIDVSTSLVELTELCQHVTGNTVSVSRLTEDRKADLRIYITDYSLFENKMGWRPKRSVQSIVSDINQWIIKNSKQLQFFKFLT